MGRVVVGAAGIMLWASPVAAQPEPFNAFLLPEVSEIEIGEIAAVSFEVDSTATRFNGYEIIIRFDPEVVDFVSVEQGSLMTQACGTNPFAVLDTTSSDSTLEYTHVILCAGIALDGPGVLSIFNFRAVANGISPADLISDPDCTFADAGVCVNPDHPTHPRQVFLHDAEIRVGATSAVGEAAAPRGPLLPQNVPNPFNPTTEFRFETAAPGPARLRVIDGRGRQVWSRSWSALPAGQHRVRWHAIAHDGGRLASGIYIYRLESGRRILSGKMTLLR